MIGVTLLIVMVMQFLSPYQRAATFVRSERQIQNIELIIRQHGLDQPFYVQYWSWLKNAASGNLGFSQVLSRPVVQAIGERLPATAELAILAIIPITMVGISLGTLAALNRDRWIDQVSRVFSIVGWSLPTFVLGLWLLLVFYGWLDWLQPGRLSQSFLIEVLSGELRRYTGMMTVDALLNGRPDIFIDALKHLLLPVLSLTFLSSAQIMRVMRSSLLDALGQDYVRTARAKGLPDRVVTRKHASRNALIPVITLAGYSFVGLLQGVVITETIYQYPGLGEWAARAAISLDYAAILGFAFVVAMIVVVVNLAVDLLYAITDPRIRFE
jgi:peptide/nickel transport system permease protein